MKWYAVWKGRKTGVFSTWAECALQVEGYNGAQYKSFPTREEAERALQENYGNFIQKAGAKVKPAAKPGVTPPLTESIAVDAACSGVPGPVEYRGVDLATGIEFFHEGPLADGTNNVGEFLALVHALRLLHEQGRNTPIYSDSRNAIGWVRGGKAKTQLARTGKNTEIFRRLAEAEQWLATHTFTNPLLKWQTQDWGENPADFGRK